MTQEKQKSFIINVVFYAIILLFIYYVFTFTFTHLTPFVFGFLIAYSLKPIVTKLTKHFGERNLIRLSVIIVFYSIVG